MHVDNKVYKFSFSVMIIVITQVVKVIEILEFQTEIMPAIARHYAVICTFEFN